MIENLQRYDYSGINNCDITKEIPPYSHYYHFIDTLRIERNLLASLLTRIR